MMLYALIAAVTGRRHCPLCHRWWCDLAAHQLSQHGNQLNQLEAMKR